MKRIFLITFIFLCQLFGFSQILHTEYWQNGTIQMNFVYIDSFKKYIAKYYYEDGKESGIDEFYNCDASKLKITIEDTLLLGFYKDWKCNAAFISFYKSGLKQSRGFYKNGLDSLSENWYENGQKSHLFFYSNGILDSLVKWYPNGNFRERGKYIAKYSKNYEHTPAAVFDLFEGKKVPLFAFRKKKKLTPLRDGNWEYYSEDGKLIKEEYWKKGKLKKTVEHK